MTNKLRIFKSCKDNFYSKLLFDIFIDAALKIKISGFILIFHHNKNIPPAIT